MAEQLKRENDIVTLKVELAPRDRVSCLLQWLDGGGLMSLPLWEGPISAFGIDCRQIGVATSWDDKTHVLPDGLRDALARGLEDVAYLAPWREQALWVHLVKPYGSLRLIPWERLLPGAADIPVLMLPDFIFPPPRRSASGLDIAICASAPLHCEDHEVFDAMKVAINAVLHGLGPHATRLHVFTDRDMENRLLGELTMTNNVKIHGSLGAAGFVDDDPSSRLHDRTGSLRSPWLLWMREALRGYSVDVVHFVCHGHLYGQSGGMLFAQSPLARTDNYFAGPVGATELGSFMTQVGAWSTAFSAPRDNHSPAGLRALADEIAQTLPGPMLLHDGNYGTPADLAQCYRFVHVEEAQSPPKSRGLFLYCQPYLLAEERGSLNDTDVRGSIHARIEHFARNDSQRASVLRTAPVATPTPTPAIAATERFAERVQLQYQQLMRDDVVPPEVASRDLDASMETIGLIREAVNLIEQHRLAMNIEARLDFIEEGLRPVGAAGTDSATARTAGADDGSGAGQRLRWVVDALPVAVRSLDAVMQEVNEEFVQLHVVQADAGPPRPVAMGEIKIEGDVRWGLLEERRVDIEHRLEAEWLRESPEDGLEAER